MHVHIEDTHCAKVKALENSSCGIPGVEKCWKHVKSTRNPIVEV
jgi:hypothetical protein